VTLLYQILLKNLHSVVSAVPSKDSAYLRSAGNEFPECGGSFSFQENSGLQPSSAFDGFL
jgi:hypothetical protein